MKYFEKNRRKLMKNHYIRGTENSVSGTSSVLIEDSAGVPIKSLQIVGKTIQDGAPTPETPIPIQNANDNGMSALLHGKNLVTTDIIKKSVWDGTLDNVYDEVAKRTRRCLAYSCNGKAVVIEGGFKENTQYTVSLFFACQPNSTANGRPFCFWYSDGTFSYAGWKDKSDYTFTRMIYTSTAGKTVTGIGVPSWDTNAKVYVDIDTFLLYEGAVEGPVYEPYFYESVEIPTSIDANGTDVPLLFTEYDKLTVDRIANKVIYTEGSLVKALTGSENWSLNAYALTVGVNICRINLNYSTQKVQTNQGYSNYFARGNWSSGLKTEKNVFYISDDVVLQLKLNGTETVEELKTLLQEKYNSGDPVTVLIQRQTPLEHDITSTELGQALLSLCVPKGASGTFEVFSDVGISSLDLSYYSEIEDNKVKLIIKYLNEAGKEISASVEHNIRKSSKYLIIPPHINGYTRVSTEVYGVADDDTIIELIYKEAK